MPKQTKANPNPWQTELLRLTLFLSPAAQVVDPSWWHDLVGQSPETIISHPREGGRHESGLWGDANLALLLQPTRIDWLLTASDDDNSKVSVTGGTFKEKLRAFRKLMCRWFEFSTCPAAQRLAFGAVLLSAVESQQDGLRQLSNLLPVELDGNGSKDFSYQINRPRPSHSKIPGLSINRLSKWAVVSRAGGSQDLACRLELDINTAPDFQGELPRASFAQLFGEFTELGQEIAEKGDIP
ncbi:MAG: hypothetical protein ACPGWR_01295 [Ardenticatenaceae bacterium]